MEKITKKTSLLHGLKLNTKIKHLIGWNFATIIDANKQFKLFK